VTVDFVRSCRTTVDSYRSVIPEPGSSHTSPTSTQGHPTPFHSENHRHFLQNVQHPLVKHLRRMRATFEKNYVVTVAHTRPLQLDHSASLEYHHILEKQGDNILGRYTLRAIIPISAQDSEVKRIERLITSQRLQHRRCKTIPALLLPVICSRPLRPQSFPRRSIGNAEESPPDRKPCGDGGTVDTESQCRHHRPRDTRVRSVQTSDNPSRIELSKAQSKRNRLAALSSIASHVARRDTMNAVTCMA
jgi:hypothetical protein